MTAQYADFRSYIDDRTQRRHWYFMFMGELFYLVEPEERVLPGVSIPPFGDRPCRALYQDEHTIPETDARFVSGRDSHVCVPCARLGMRAGDFW